MNAGSCSPYSTRREKNDWRGIEPPAWSVDAMPTPLGTTTFRGRGRASGRGKTAGPPSAAHLQFQGAAELCTGARPPLRSSAARTVPRSAAERAATEEHSQPVLVEQPRPRYLTCAGAGKGDMRRGRQGRNPGRSRPVRTSPHCARPAFPPTTRKYHVAEEMTAAAPEPARGARLPRRCSEPTHVGANERGRD